jgi:hydrogenase/urease accessory protein HupE
VLTATWLDGSEVKRLFQHEAGTITVNLAELQAGSGSLMRAAGRYTSLGIEHILLGIDHLLFVLALLLIVRGAWMLVKTITAFTVAHSITLGLATLGFIHVPSRPVEAAIALSIVFLCVEIIHARQHKIGLTYRFPWLVALLFGLLHGLGFAGALSEIGLPQSEIPIALLFFNIGVEIGQLIFVFVVLILEWLMHRLRVTQLEWVRALPVYFIGMVATYWFVERTLSILQL